MSLARKLTIPGVAVIAGLVGIGGSALVTNITANAATTTGNSPTSNTSTTDTDGPGGGTAPSGPHTANGITETVLTGDTLTKATAAAQAAEPGATVERAETDAEGAKYEVHMTKSDGSEVTVKLDANFNVTSTESGR